MARAIYISVLSVVFLIVGIFGLMGNDSRGAETVAAVETIELPAATDWTVEPGLSQDGNVWAVEILADYGLELPTGASILITDEENCGSELGGYGTGGGCYTWETKVIRISPTLIGTDAGRITVLHEYAHALGFRDECAAEAYAHSLFDTPLYGYPECSPAWQE